MAKEKALAHKVDNYNVDDLERLPGQRWLLTA